MSTHEDVRPIPSSPLVVVASDDPTHRAIVARMVRTLGYRAHACIGSIAALHFLRTRAREVRLLLTDVGLRGMDGYEIMERASGWNPRLDTVLMATISGPDIDELIDQIPFVARPVQFGPLARTLHDLLGQVPAPQPRLAARRPGWYRIP